MPLLLLLLPYFVCTQCSMWENKGCSQACLLCPLKNNSRVEGESFGYKKSSYPISRHSIAPDGCVGLKRDIIS